MCQAAEDLHVLLTMMIFCHLHQDCCLRECRKAKRLILCCRRPAVSWDNLPDSVLPLIAQHVPFMERCALQLPCTPHAVCGGWCCTTRSTVAPRTP